MTHALCLLLPPGIAGGPRDMRSLLRRLHNIGDALSQLLQVICAPRPFDTNANESLSGRSHREGWWLEKAIDALFWVIERDHCKNAVLRDAERAKAYLRQIGED